MSERCERVSVRIECLRLATGVASVRHKKSVFLLFALLCYVRVKECICACACVRERVAKLSTNCLETDLSLAPVASFMSRITVLFKFLRSA